MIDAQLYHALQKLKRAQSGDREKSLQGMAVQLQTLLYTAQRECSVDPHPFVAICCPRRVGKTFWVAVETLCTLATVEEAHVVYITLIRDQAKRNFWEPLQMLAERVGMNVDVNESDLRLTNQDTGGWAMLRGCETEADCAKFEGTYYHRAFIDEAQAFGLSTIVKLIENSLTPCLGDVDGRLYMMGRPVGVFAGRFYEATNDKASLIRVDETERRAVSRPWQERALPRWEGVDFAWSLHTWSQERAAAEAGPGSRAARIWSNSLKVKRINGWADTHPTWMREALGLWSADDSLLVYRFDARLAPEGTLWAPESDLTEEQVRKNPFRIPGGHKVPLRYVIGVDMGQSDPRTIQVFAYSPNLRVCYGACYEYESIGISLRAMAMEIVKAVAYCAAWDGVEGEEIEVRDGALTFGVGPGEKIGARLLEYMRLGLDLIDDIYGDIDKMGGEVLVHMLHEYGIRIIPAKKKNKRDHQEAFNTDLVDRRMLIKAGSRLAAEMAVLAWDDSGLKEKSGQKNNNCDSGLYAGVNCRHHDAQELIFVPPESPEQRSARRMAEHRQRLSRPRSADERFVDIGAVAPIDAWGDV